jgi:uncharacterized protein
MIKNILLKKTSNPKIDVLIERYNIPKRYLYLNRKTVSNAVFIGIFFAMMPIPLQMFAVIFCIPFFTFNVPLALSLVWINNPITIPFIFYFEYLLGSNLIDSNNISKLDLSFEWFQDNFGTILEPLLLGALFIGTALAFTSKYLVNFFWRRSVRRKRFLR